jgi:hypothetical protein
VAGQKRRKGPSGAGSIPSRRLFIFETDFSVRSPAISADGEVAIVRTSSGAANQKEMGLIMCWGKMMVETLFGIACSRC